MNPDDALLAGQRGVEVVVEAFGRTNRGQCTPRFVLPVVLTLKYRLSLAREDRYTVKIALRLSGESVLSSIS